MTPSENPEEVRLDPGLAALTAGSRVGGGRFVLLRLLGRGGMGVVWLARDEHLREGVALKFLPPEIRHDAVALDDLRRETARSRKLTHPQIIRIHDLYKVEQEAFISMEYVDGPNLSELRLQQPDRVLKWSFVEPLVRELCGALEYAHGENIIHRDIKPANMMLDGRGRLKLADFGIAAAVTDTVSRMSIGRHFWSGTACYMSPQQLNGQNPHATDDIYSLGATLYELLTSRPPFFAGDIPHQVRSLPPQPIEKRLSQLNIHNPVPPVVASAIMDCLAKEPEKRPQSAQAFADQIGFGILSVVARSDTPSRPAQIAEPPKQPVVLKALHPVVAQSAMARNSQATPATAPRAEASAYVAPDSAPPDVAAVPRTRLDQLPSSQPPASGEPAGQRPAPAEQRPSRRGTSAAAIAAALAIVALAGAGYWSWSKKKLADTNPPPPVPEFVSIFNGDFSGWDGDPQVWMVKDGAITATNGMSKEKRPLALFWRGMVEDFELRLSFRIRSGNSGIYYRAKQLLGYEVGGYQFEISGNQTGALIESGSDRTRRDPSRRGSVTTTVVTNKKEQVVVVGPTDSSALEVREAFHQTGWNDVVILVQSNRLIHKLNGHTMVDATDTSEKRPRRGTIAFEVYGAVPTSVQFRDIQLKKLPSPSASMAAAKR